SAASSAHDYIRNAAAVCGEFVLGFCSADKADRHADDERRLWRTSVQQFEKAEEGRWRIADCNNTVAKMRKPEVERCGRAGIADLHCKLRNRWVAKRADDFIIGR